MLSTEEFFFEASYRTGLKALTPEPLPVCEALYCSFRSAWWSSWTGMRCSLLGFLYCLSILSVSVLFDLWILWASFICNVLILILLLSIFFFLFGFFLFWAECILESFYLSLFSLGLTMPWNLCLYSSTLGNIFFWVANCFITTAYQYRGYTLYRTTQQTFKDWGVSLGKAEDLSPGYLGGSLGAT